VGIRETALASPETADARLKSLPLARTGAEHDDFVTANRGGVAQWISI
jgi:hypothetical protein